MSEEVKEELKPLKPSDLAKLAEQKALRDGGDTGKQGALMGAAMSSSKYLYMGMRNMTTISNKMYVVMVSIVLAGLVTKSIAGFEEYYGLVMNALVGVTLFIGLVTFAIYILLLMFNKFNQDNLEMLDVEIWKLTRNWTNWYTACWGALGKMSILLAGMYLWMTL